MFPNTSEIRAEINRILQSRWFRESAQLKALLEYTVEQTLAGHTDSLKEYSLGREVFNRKLDYDPRNDSIVRVQAYLLRKRLASYYANEGIGSSIRIDIPRGHYVPKFVKYTPDATSRTSGSLFPDSTRADRHSSQPTASNITSVNEWRTARSKRRAWMQGAIAFVAGAIGAIAGLKLQSDSSAPDPTARTSNGMLFNVQETSPTLWASILDNQHPILLSFGCPQFFAGGGLFLRDVQVNSTASPEITRLQEIAEKLHIYFSPRPNTYTGVGEMRGIFHLGQFLGQRGIVAEIENVQLLTTDAIAGKNLIVVSSYRFQTLLDGLDLPRLITPRFARDGGFLVEHAGQQPSRFYGPRNAGGLQFSYALVSFWRSPANEGDIMLLSGIESWATYGAVAYITDRVNLDHLEQLLASEWKSQHRGVQVLLQIEGRDDRFVRARYHLHRMI